MRSSEYYGGVTQGFPLFPWIFNFVVDEIICNWVGLVKYNKAGTDVFFYTVVDKLAFFYSDNGLISSNNPV